MLIYCKPFKYHNLIKLWHDVWVDHARNSKPRTAKRVLNLSRSENTSVYNLIQFQRRLCMLFLQDYKEIVKHSHKIIDTYNYIFCFSNNLCRYIFLTAEPGNCVNDMKKAVVHFLTWKFSGWHYGSIHSINL